MNLSLLNLLVEKLPYFVLNFMNKILRDETRQNYKQMILNEFQKYADDLDNYNVNDVIFSTVDNAILSIFSDLQLPLDKNKCLDENGLEIAQNILEELLEIKKLLLESSKEIENIFSHCLKTILDNEVKEIDFKLIHLELFSEKLVSNRFISGLLILILKNEDKKLDHLKNLAKKVCNYPCGINEVKKFKIQIEKYFKLKQMFNKENRKLKKILCIDDNIDFTSFEGNDTQEDLYIYNDIQHSNNINNNSINSDKKEERDLDEWVNYIGVDDEKKKRRKKKKNKNKKREEKNENNNNNDYQKGNGDDMEIQMIKKSFIENSCNKYSIRKIRPNINQEWINNIINIKSPQ